LGSHLLGRPEAAEGEVAAQEVGHALRVGTLALLPSAAGEVVPGRRREDPGLVRAVPPRAGPR